MSGVLDDYAIAPSIREFIARPHGILIDGWRDAVAGQEVIARGGRHHQSF